MLKSRKKVGVYENVSASDASLLQTFLQYKFVLHSSPQIRGRLVVVQINGHASQSSSVSR